VCVCVCVCWQAYDEARRRVVKESADRQVIVPELRKQSRRDYLRKRHAEKLEDLEMEIDEDEYYFGGACVCIDNVSSARDYNHTCELWQWPTQ